MMAQKIFRNIYVMFTLVVMSFVVASCDKSEDEFLLNTYNNGGNNNSEITINVKRDAENGIIEASREVNGLRQDTTITVALGAVNFEITPVDTIKVASAEVIRSNFAEVGEAEVEEYEENGVYFTKTSKSYRDELTGYAKDINISYLDAYTYVWGKKVEFPQANGAVEVVEEINLLDEGIKEKMHYYTATTQYKVAFMEGSSVEKGLEVLAIDADDTLLSTEKTDEGYETLTSTTAKSWIEITRTYKISGAVATRYEVVLNNGVSAPAYEVMNVESFNLSSKGANLEEASVSGNREEGNIKVTSYRQNYVVGNNIFDRTFVLSYETAVLTVDDKTFDMPSRKYENVTDGNFNITDMEGITGYDRVLYTHNMSATFNGNSVAAKAEVELRMVEVKDELISRVIVEDGKDYINASTTKSWVKVKEVWSVGGEKVYTKSVNLINGIAAPAKITKILASFDLNSAAASLGGEKLVKTETKGDFKVMTYERTYTVANDKFTRVFTLSYQKAVYTVINHDMPYSEYENVADNGFNMSDMSNTTQNGKTYNRKNYVHAMSAMFNGYDAKANAEAELLVEVETPRDTPSWLGNQTGAKYTRVQKAAGQKFMDMIVFTYENGVVMAPNGKVDMSLIYAFNASVASANGVDVCINGAYSGVFGNGKWQPAKITMVSGRWIYAGKSSSWDHTVMETNAVTLGIGVDVTPIPSAQKTTISNGKITISYAANNGSTTANSSLSLR